MNPLVVVRIHVPELIHTIQSKKCDERTGRKDKSFFVFQIPSGRADCEIRSFEARGFDTSVRLQNKVELGTHPGPRYETVKSSFKESGSKKLKEIYAAELAL